MQTMVGDNFAVFRDGGPVLGIVQFIFGEDIQLKQCDPQCDQLETPLTQCQPRQRQQFLTNGNIRQDSLGTVQGNSHIPP